MTNNNINPSPQPIGAAYLGPSASYTHQAAQRLQPLNPHLNLQLDPIKTIPSLFDTVQSRTHPLAICPIENSTNGPVGTTLDLLANAATNHPDVRIIGEVRVRVAHCLVVRRKGWRSRKASTTGFGTPEASVNVGVATANAAALAAASHSPTFPSTSPSPSPSTAASAVPVTVDSPPRFETPLSAVLEDRLLNLGALTTHPQAWTQCTRFLSYIESLRASHNRPVPRRIDASSTSGAALGLVDDTTTSEFNVSPTPPRRASLFEGFASLFPAAYGERGFGSGGNGNGSERREEREREKDRQSGTGTPLFDEEREIAAISSALAASLSPELEVLLTGLEDSDDNYTRFLVLCHREVEGVLGVRTVPDGVADAEGEEVVRKACVAFTLGHVPEVNGHGSGNGSNGDNRNSNEDKAAPAKKSSRAKTRPGALAKALSTFERRHLNLTSINARPSRKAAWDYTFVVEVEVPNGGTEEQTVQETVEEVKRVAGGDAYSVGIWAWDENV